MTFSAKDLDHTHITNLITVEHYVRFEGREDSSQAFTTGQLMSITRVLEFQYTELIVGGKAINVSGSDEVTIHSTHVGMLAPELLDTLNSTKEN